MKREEPHRFAVRLFPLVERYYQLVIDEDDVAAGAAKLPHLEAGRELLGSLPAEGILFDGNKITTFLFSSIR